MSVKESIVELGPWFHQIEIDGNWTRDIAPAPGPQPRNHPHARWEAIRCRLPDLQGKSVLDLGCADGYFAIELARLGANVEAVDGAGKMVRRLQWAAETLNLDINARVGKVEEIEGSYDFVFFIGVLYHLESPLLGLKRVAALSNAMAIETVVTGGGMSRTCGSSRPKTVCIAFRSGFPRFGALRKCCVLWVIASWSQWPTLNATG